MSSTFSAEQWAKALKDALAGARNTWQGHAPTPAPAPRRRDRGDVRVAILALLAEHPMHGYQLIREITERTGGAWKPSPGSVYPTLQLLADEGLVVAAEDGERKSYSLTAAGKSAAPGPDTPLPWDDDPAQPQDDEVAPTNHGRAALPQAGLQLARALAQVAREGSDEQLARAVEVTDDARRRLYAILAED